MDLFLLIHCICPVAYPQGRTGGRVPQILGRGTVMQKSTHFLTHNDAIAGFTSKRLGLPAYAYKTDSSTAIKLAPRICHFKLKNLKKIWGWGIAPPLVGRGHHLPTPSAPHSSP